LDASRTRAALSPNQYRRNNVMAVGCLQEAHGVLRRLRVFPQGWNEGHIISLKEGDGTILEPGMVFHMPPSLRIYHEACVGVSETVLVTDNGHEVITRFPRDLAVAQCR